MLKSIFILVSFVYTSIIFFYFIFNTYFTSVVPRGVIPVSPWGRGGGVFGQTLPKFTISKFWGHDFCKHQSILESTKVVKFAIKNVYKTIITNIT